MQRDAFYAIPEPCHERDSNRVTKSVTARPQSIHLPSIASPHARPPGQTRPNPHTCLFGQVAAGNPVAATVRKRKARVAQLGRSSAKRGGAPWRATTLRPNKEGAPQRAGFEAKPPVQACAVRRVAYCDHTAVQDVPPESHDRRRRAPPRT